MSYLFWLYFINAVLLITHEIDSAYWKEWDLFKLPGGIQGFLLLHFPMLAFILYGLVLVYQNSFWGLIFSLILSLGGIFAFAIHTFFIKRGRKEFTNKMSYFLLGQILIFSIAQLIFTLRALIK